MGDFDRISSFVRLCSWGTRATQKAVITRKGAGPISLLLLGDNCRLKFFTRQYGSKDCRIFFLFCCLIVTSVSAFGGPTPISYSLSKNYTFSTTANVQPTLNEMRYASANVNATVTALAAKTATGTLIVSGSISAPANGEQLFSIAGGVLTASGNGTDLKGSVTDAAGMVINNLSAPRAIVSTLVKTGAADLVDLFEYDSAGDLFVKTGGPSARLTSTDAH